MSETFLNEYNRITDEIQAEKDARFRGLISRLAKRGAFKGTPNSSGPETDTSETESSSLEDIFKEDRKIECGHRSNLLALECLRICVNCKMIQSDCYEKKEEFQQDISDALDNMTYLEHFYNINDKTAADTLDLLFSVCPSGKEIIQKSFGREYTFSSKKFLKQKRKFTVVQFFIFYNIADYYRKTERFDIAFLLAEKIADISSKRSSIKLLREIVPEILLFLYDKAPEITYRICRRNNRVFEGCNDKHSSIFLWFYAFSLEKMQDIAEALKYYEKCYRCRKRVYGENTWLTDAAKREVNRISYIMTKSKKNRESLITFIDNVECGNYDTEVNDKKTLEIIEGRTLYLVLREFSHIDDPERFDKYLKIYQSICEKYDGQPDEPLLKIRLAKNTRAGYCMKINNYQLSEIFFIEALDAALPDGTPEILTEAQIKSNLLLTYAMQNDMDKARPLLKELIEMLESRSAECGLSKEDEMRIYIAGFNILKEENNELYNENIGVARELVNSTYNDLFIYRKKDAQIAGEIAAFLVFYIYTLLSNENFSEKDHRHNLELLLNIEKQLGTLKFDKGRRAMLYEVIAIELSVLGRSGTAEYLKKGLRLIDDNNIPKLSQAEFYYIIVTYYLYWGKISKSSRYIEKILSLLTDLWQSYVQYLNDTRLLQILYPVQTLFTGCYNIIKNIADTEYTYEKLLNFKALASLAGRERNRIIHNGNIDKTLLDSIREMQDKVALSETENMYQPDSRKYEEYSGRLRTMENEFALRFPGKTEFTDISLKKTEDAIPDNSAVAEYFMCNTDYDFINYENQDNNDAGQDSSAVFDIYIILKADNECTVTRITVPNADYILNNTREFIEILQAESENTETIEQVSKIEDIRSELYKSLIKPLLPYIKGAKNLYLAPDTELLNLPFGILYDEDEKRLDENYNVIMIECARDFLYNNNRCAAEKGNLIIGNPKYKLDEDELGTTADDSGDSSSSRAADIQSNDIKQLPFSELEAERVAERSGSRYFTGSDASKDLFLTAEGYENVHVSTHGCFDLTNETQAIYSSCLLFAGVKNWLETGENSEIYGNGIVTADEISRMNLRSIKLLVLSSCLNGMNELVEGKGFNGMTGALSAAGVQYVVCSLWSADDFATAILMDEFYKQYFGHKEPPPIALKSAKKRLQDMTAADLKKLGWFDWAKKVQMQQNTEIEILKCEKLGDDFRPFKNEIYWGGFICCRCN